MDWYVKVLKKYATFSGRAQRAELWFFVLFNILILIGLMVVESVIGTSSEGGIGVLTALYALGVMLPSIAVCIRRLHDTGRSGWWYLLSLIPLVSLVLLYFFIQDSEPGANQYGPNPKEAVA